VRGWNEYNDGDERRRFELEQAERRRAEEEEDCRRARHEEAERLRQDEARYERQQMEEREYLEYERETHVIGWIVSRLTDMAVQMPCEEFTAWISALYLKHGEYMFKNKPLNDILFPVILWYNDRKIDLSQVVQDVFNISDCDPELVTNEEKEAD